MQVGRQRVIEVGQAMYGLTIQTQEYCHWKQVSSRMLILCVTH